MFNPIGKVGIQMKEIPIPYIRAHQTGIVVFFLAAVILQQPPILYALAVIQVLAPLFGSLFTLLAKPFLKSRAARSQTQSAELTNFNNSLGILFITLSLIGFSLGSEPWGYLFAAAFALAAGLALTGFCIGCLVYYRIKRARQSLNHS